MLGLFKKKKKEEAEEKKDAETESKEEKPSETPSASTSGGGADVTRLGTEVDKIKSSVEAFGEVRTSMTERMNQMSEQIGELRAMIMDRDKMMQEIELKSIKAADLVEAVHPEKLMVEVKKQEAKFEALKASLEGNESVIERVIEELKGMRNKLNFFRGVEEIIKLSEEIKQELIEVKKVEGKIGLNTDKVETIYAEMRKKYKDADMFRTEFQEMGVGVKQNMKDVEFLKNKVSGLVEKNELENLVSKVQRYIDALKNLEKKSSLSKDMDKLKDILDSLK